MRKLIALAAAALLAACAGSQTQTAGAPAAGAPRFNRNVITVEEMRAQRITHAEEAVRILRPTWLQQRGATSMAVDTRVRYYTDTSIRPLSGLHRLPSGQTAAILYFPPLEAQTRFGLNHQQGAIAILLPGGSLP
ncbi:MAG TPA: hypothetical protein VLK84_03830 [Longimicrobium sp.]|nr:hypothetical protein [Longimicrobium sp.]